MGNDKAMMVGVGALLGFAGGVLLGQTLGGRGRPEGIGAEPGPDTRFNADLTTTTIRNTLVADLRRQESVVRKGIVQLTLSLGEPGADQIGLAGKIAGLSADLTKLESRRRLAELDAAAVPFPGQTVIDKLRRAVGELEQVIAQAKALTTLLEKTSAAIAAWKA